MIVVMKKGTDPAEIKNLAEKFKAEHNVKAEIIPGSHITLIGLIGDTTYIDIDRLRANRIVSKVKLVEEPFKKANRKFHPDDTVIKIGSQTIGDGGLAIIAGPCSVESDAQIIEVARRVKAAGAGFLRGGAFKPRTSPYAFQGMRTEGIELLLKARQQTGLPIVTEIMSTDQIECFQDVDVIQVGARNMQNFELLKVLGELTTPILLKRGLANTIEETLMSAEYIMAAGNPNVILCERGIRTFESYTRNTLDISAIPAFKKLSHLPVVIDPSHAAGIRWTVEPLALAAVAAGADGIMVEVHNDPEHALCDGPQSITPDEFDKLAEKLRKAEAFRNSIKD